MKDEMRFTEISERHIELNSNDVMNLLIQAGITGKMDPGDSFTVTFEVPSGGDWSGLIIHLNETPIKVCITRKKTGKV